MKTDRHTSAGDEQSLPATAQLVFDQNNIAPQNQQPPYIAKAHLPPYPRIEIYCVKDAPKMNAQSIIGWMLFSTGLMLIARKIAHESKWKQTEGMVVSLGSVRLEKGEDPIPANYTPVVRFTTEDNEIMNEVVWDMRLGRCKIGEKIPLIYNSSKPAQFYSTNPLRRFGIAGALILTGLTVVIDA